MSCMLPNKIVRSGMFLENRTTFGENMQHARKSKIVTRYWNHVISFLLHKTKLGKRFGPFAGCSDHFVNSLDLKVGAYAEPFWKTRLELTLYHLLNNTEQYVEI